MKDRDEKIAEGIRELIQNDIEDIETALADSYQQLHKLLDKHSDDLPKRLAAQAKELLEEEKARMRRIEREKSRNPAQFYVFTVEAMEVTSISMAMQHKIHGEVPDREFKEFERLSKDAEKLREKAKDSDPESRKTVKMYEETERESVERVSKLD